MVKKIMESGIPLKTEEMKEIKGGTSAVANRLWRCLVDGIYDNVCYSIEPSVPYHYVEVCTEIGTCPGPSLCIQ